MSDIVGCECHLGTWLNSQTYRLHLPQLKVVMVHSERQSWFDNLKLWEGKRHMKVDETTSFTISLIPRPPPFYFSTCVEISEDRQSAILIQSVKCEILGALCLAVSGTSPEHSLSQNELHQLEDLLLKAEDV